MCPVCPLVKTALLQGHFVYTVAHKKLGPDLPNIFDSLTIILR